MKKSYRTSIALDEHSAEIAERLPNLSAFVREQLYRWAAEKQMGRHVQAPEFRIHEKCSAMHKNLCYVCWPDGRPTRDDWFRFRKSDRGIHIPASWEGERSKHFAIQTRPDNIPEEKGRQTPLDNRPRFWNWLLGRIRPL